MKNKGFTLVELIVVIAVLAVLMALIVPQYIQYVDKARVAVCENARGELARYYDAERIWSNEDGAALMKKVLELHGRTVTSSTADKVQCTGLCPSDKTAVFTFTLSGGEVKATDCSAHGEGGSVLLVGGRHITLTDVKNRPDSFGGSFGLEKGKVFTKDGKYYVMKGDYTKYTSEQSFWKEVSNGASVEIKTGAAYSEDNAPTYYYAGDIYIQDGVAYVNTSSTYGSPTNSPNSWVKIGTTSVESN